MKKLNYLGCLLLLFCVVSCGYYVPEKDYSERLSKMEYKSFESLNNPFIFRFDAKLNFNSRVISRDRGSFYFIYDWENDEIFDYVYSPKDDSYENFLFRCRNDENNLEYIGFDYFDEEQIRVFSMKSNKNAVEESLLNNRDVFNNVNQLNFYDINFQQGKDYQILFYNGFDDIFLMYFDVNSKSITKTKKLSVKDAYSVDVFVDSNGVCWYLEYFEKDGKKFERMCSYDFATDIEIKDYLVFDCIGESNTYDNYKGWIYEDYYSLEYIDSEFIVIRKNMVDRSEENLEESNSYLVINKNDKSQKAFKFDDSETYIKDFVKIHDEYYIILHSSDDKLEIQKVNMKTLERKSLLKRNSLWYSKMEVRDNKIYFIDKTDSEIEAKIYYFDVQDNNFYECEKINLEEYFEKLEENY